MDLHARFLSFARSHGAEPQTAEAWWQTVAAHYREPHRHYHTLRHIEEMLDLLPDADETTLAAVWFHDVVYGGDVNEERSAALARHALADLQFPAGAIDVVATMIIATKRHDPSSLPPPCHAFLDADLAILGSDTDRYREYVNAIREEYAWVPEDVFRDARARVLRNFLDRPSIYATDAFREKFETKARENMEGEMNGER